METFINCAFILLAVGFSIGVVYGVMILLALGILDIFKKVTSN